MKVLKFGSSAVASAQRIKEVAKIVGGTSAHGDVVVLSAISGTTACLRDVAGKSITQIGSCRFWH